MGDGSDPCARGLRRLRGDAVTCVNAFAFHAHRQLPPPLLLHRLVATFWLPLEVCPIVSNSAGIPATAERCAKALRGAVGRCLGLMEAQALRQGGRPVEPLERSTVRVVRYSLKAGDAQNASGKVPVDRLLPNRTHRGKPVKGLGYIADDDGGHCRKIEEWRPAKRGDGAVLVEVWEPTNHEAWSLGAWTTEDIQRARRLLCLMEVVS